MLGPRPSAPKLSAEHPGQPALTQGGAGSLSLRLAQASRPGPWTSPSENTPAMGASFSQIGWPWGPATALSSRWPAVAHPPAAALPRDPAGAGTVRRWALTPHRPDCPQPGTAWAPEGQSVCVCVLRREWLKITLQNPENGDGEGGGKGDGDGEHM